MPLLMGLFSVIFTTRSLNFLAGILVKIRYTPLPPEPPSRPESLESTHIYPYIDSYVQRVQIMASKRLNLATSLIIHAKPIHQEDSLFHQKRDNSFEIVTGVTKNACSVQML